MAIRFAALVPMVQILPRNQPGEDESMTDETTVVEVIDRDWVAQQTIDRKRWSGCGSRLCPTSRRED